MSAYKKCVDDSELIRWKINDIVSDDFVFDTNDRYLPTSLTSENKLDFLNEAEKKVLNQVRSASYASTFAFVEEYIAVLMMNIAVENSYEDNNKLRAFLKFSEDEVKHQEMFLKFVRKFDEQFYCKGSYLEGADEVANVVLSNSELSVLILTYHLEIVSQAHYLEAVKSDASLNADFKHLLKAHWLEESQHIKVDYLRIEEIVNEIEVDELERSFQEYFAILENLKILFKQQTELDIQTFQKASQRILSEEEREKYIRTQYHSYVYTLIQVGYENRQYLRDIEKIYPGYDAVVAQKINDIDADFEV